MPLVNGSKRLQNETIPRYLVGNDDVGEGTPLVVAIGFRKPRPVFGGRVWIRLPWSGSSNG